MRAVPFLIQAMGNEKIKNSKNGKDNATPGNNKNCEGVKGSSHGGGLVVTIVRTVLYEKR